MQADYWHKQESEPLFPDLLWSRPENKRQAGKLLIVGGHAQSFAAPAEAYGEAVKAGVGTARVLLPDVLHKTVSKLFPAAEFAPSTPSGGFAKTSLGEMLAMAHSADGVLLAGDFGRNSETAIVLESFLEKFEGTVVLTKDAADYFTPAPAPLLNRENSGLVVSFAQLQKMAVGAHFPSAFTFDMDLVRLVDVLHSFTQEYPVKLITKHLDTVFVAASGQISTTKLTKDIEVWRLKTAAHAAVWWLQNPNKPFEALTTAAGEITSA